MKKILLTGSIILCAVLFVCGFGCEEIVGEWTIRVENKSNKDVYFVVGLNWINNKYYPTIRLPNDSINSKNLVKAGKRIPLDYGDPKHVNVHASDSIAIFVFDPDTIAMYTWAQLGDGEKYLKKYELVGSDLSASPDNPIIYP